MTIREPEPGDQGYVIKTWTRSLLSARPWKGMSRAAFAAVEASIERLMDRSDTRALIATAVAPDLCGWMVWTPMGAGAAVHYVYVRKAERTRGIGRALFEASRVRLDRPIVYTFAGPAHRWVVPKAPTAVPIAPENFLDPRRPRR